MRSLNDNDFYLFQEGTHSRLSEVLGAHYSPEDGSTRFAVWAPNARSVSVVGDFSDWQSSNLYLRRTNAGLWHGFGRDIGARARYKFLIESDLSEYKVQKADPFAFTSEQGGANASIVCSLDYTWNDGAWLQDRGNQMNLDAPVSIYEVHLGSWRRAQDGRHLTYRELAEHLIPYAKEMGFTHLEFLPVMEHPFYGSWGYQTTGYFAPTSRYGSPQDLMYLVDQCHQNGMGVILDWVPSHFPRDEYSLGYFDGAHEYEPADPRRGVHPDWNSFIFDYGRPEVRSFLLSSAMFWLDTYHADALRVDGVASMLYLDYSRRPGEWIPNQYGGRENLDAIAFLRVMNEHVYQVHPDTQTVAEESTAWPNVSRPTYLGGLGFGYKWDMGWMHDTLQYLSMDPIYRSYHHGELTFRMDYAFSENFVLPLSHDEVVYGKGSLLNKMPGDTWKKFAGLRLLLSYMYAQPGKKLLFMGGEFGQWSEWNHDDSLEWHLLEHPEHAGLRLLVGDLNHLYRTQPALHVGEARPECFEWVDAWNAEANVVVFRRKAGGSDEKCLLVACNFSAISRPNYQIGVNRHGEWHEIFNSDAKPYGGSGFGHFAPLHTVPVPATGRPYSITANLPPLGVLFLQEASKSG